MVIAFPSAAGLTVLGGPIVKSAFPRLPEYQDLAAMLLTAGSAAVVPYALSTITTSILQGQNYMRLPVFHSGVSLIIHVILVWGLLKYTDLGVYGLVIGNVSFSGDRESFEHESYGEEAALPVEMEDSSGFH